MLRGERVLLRDYRREDVPLRARFLSDLDVELAAGGDAPRPVNVERLQKLFEQDLVNEGHNPYIFAMEADGRFIGICGLTGPHHMNRTVELFIIIGDKEYWGRGDGRETIGLLLDYAFRLHNYRKVWISAKADNERALRCYRASGFVEERRLREHEWSNGRYVDVVEMGVLRRDWEQERDAATEASAERSVTSP